MTTLYVRKGKTITTLATENSPATSKVHDSINLAKKASRDLQLSKQGNLGRGCLRVE